MRLFRTTKSTTPQVPSQEDQADLRFASTKALETSLDGSEEAYSRYHFALYQCAPDERGGINELRESLRVKYPDRVIQVGRRFVLDGEAAFVALSSYYQALTAAETLSSEYHGYISARLADIKNIHSSSQSLPVPINLTEGQLASDPQLEFLTCVALMRGQVIIRNSE
ncbi:MAG: hypothetical protein P4L83_01390 [Nevskia sp.]|nr:hypothetical protein [Nevskia sp.]